MAIEEWVVLMAARTAVSAIWRRVGVSWVFNKIINCRTGRVMARGFEYYPGRSAIQRVIPLRKLLDVASVIDAVYMNGRAIIALDHPNLNKIQRIILPDPQHQTFDALANIEAQMTPDLGTSIRSAIAHFKAKGCKVYLYPGWISNSLQIIDYHKESGWAQVELVFHELHQDKRPVLVFRKHGQSEILQELVSSFRSMLVQCHEA